MNDYVTYDVFDCQDNNIGEVYYDSNMSIDDILNDLIVNCGYPERIHIEVQENFIYEE